RRDESPNSTPRSTVPDDWRWTATGIVRHSGSPLSACGQTRAGDTPRGRHPVRGACASHPPETPAKAERDRWLWLSVLSAMLTVMSELFLAQEPAADEMLRQDPLALLIAMLLDQQIPLEKAFAGPLRLAERLGVAHLDAAAIADHDPQDFAAI